MANPSSAPVFDNSYARLPGSFHAQARPTPVSAPRLVRLNRGLADDLGLDADWLESSEGQALLAGNRTPEEAEPLAMAYAGHQFGNFVPSLGDGRAILLGEIRDQEGVLRDIQLKGAGRTPFSRAGDGRAGLPSVIREYLASEAMAGLGIPTQRALALVTTGEPVYREEVEPGAILARVSTSHVRFGTFQYFLWKEDTEALSTLAHYVIHRHYPWLAEQDAPWLALLDEVVERTASLVAGWMLKGFIHGVMNTDNMSIVGETLDFGPFGFMDGYHPETVFSFIDQGGRYAFNQQPGIASWNLARFAETLLPLLEASDEDPVAAATERLKQFGPRFEAHYEAGLRAKFGLQHREDGDMNLVNEFHAILARQRVDYTLAFRALSDASNNASESDQPLRDLFSHAAPLDQWMDKWRARLAREQREENERRAAMRAVNPAFILRNHQARQVTDAAVNDNDFQPLHELLEVLAAPFEDHPGREHWARPPRPGEEVPYTTCGT